MRTLVDIPESELEALAAICKAEKLSRAAVIRKAIAAYIAQHRPDDLADDAAFGSWGPGEDGLAYQERLRSEW
jgi:metal-responsive CopG/Arc/MetJ family transcriptional regulator